MLEAGLSNSRGAGRIMSYQVYGRFGSPGQAAVTAADQCYNRWPEEQPLDTMQRQALYCNVVSTALCAYHGSPEGNPDAFSGVAEAMGQELSGGMSMFLSLLSDPAVQNQYAEAAPMYWQTNGLAADVGEMFYNIPADRLSYFTQPTAQRIQQAPLPSIDDGFAAAMEAQADAITSSPFAPLNAQLKRDAGWDLPEPWNSCIPAAAKLVPLIISIADPPAGVVLTVVTQTVMAANATPDVTQCINSILNGTTQTQSQTAPDDNPPPNYCSVDGSDDGSGGGGDYGFSPMPPKER